MDANRLQAVISRWFNSILKRSRLPKIRSKTLGDYPHVDLSVHVLTCHRQVDMALWALKTFLFFAERQPFVIIHDDGSLTRRDRCLLERQIPNASVIGGKRGSREVTHWLESYPACRNMRLQPKFYCTRKLFDPWYYASSDRILLLDSDILFFRKPEELLGLVDADQPFFLSDYQTDYKRGLASLDRFANTKTIERVNAGLLFMNRKHFDLSFVEKYFRQFPETTPPINRHEQTIYALLMSRIGGKRLSDDYQISRQTIRQDTACHHYVNDGSRMNFWKQGIPELTARGFLERQT